MNRLALEAQLAQLEGDPRDEIAPKGSIFEPLPKNWKPEPRIQPQHLPGSDPTTFKIGDRDERYHKPQAIPPFRYPNPGQPSTKEIEAAELRHSVVWATAQSYLRDSIRYVADDLQKRSPGLSGYEQMRAEKWGYLLGLWASHQMEPPSEQTMQEWAREYLAVLTAKSTSQSEQELG